MKVVGFAGYSGAGKTTLIERLIPPPQARCWIGTTPSRRRSVWSTIRRCSNTTAPILDWPQASPQMNQPTLRSLDDALAELLAHATPLPDAETVSTFDADGRVLATDL